jgi:iron complex outermembrane receptor protein
LIGLALLASPAASAEQAATSSTGGDADTTRAAARELTPAFAVDEVVITGTRTHKRIVDVPFAIDRVDMADKGFERKVAVDDVLADIPGVFMQSRYGNHDVRISIRGFGSRSNTGIRGVRILLDGIPESEPDGQTRIEAIDFHALGSIEIVKGNASSLYPNAPGGVINFLSDLRFHESHVMSFNEFGSQELRRNGYKVGVKTDRYRLLSTYSYHTAKGYRAHSEDHGHVANAIVESNPGADGTLRVYAYVADGMIRLPGSIKGAEFDADPFRANARDVGRDAKRITRKGRVGVRYETLIGDDEVELTAHASIKYFERTARTYRLFNRDGLGVSARFVSKARLGERRNEFSVGGDLFYQWGPIQEFDNINGMKGDALVALTDERIGNAGLYVQNTLALVPERLDLLLTGRYDNVLFDAQDELLGVRSAKRRFEDFTPKAALNFKLTPKVATYASYGLGFDTPAGNELDNFPTSSEPNIIINPDLEPQHSKNFEIGLKGGVASATRAAMSRIDFNATYFNTKVEDEIVPFDVLGDAFFRNSAMTSRSGIELGVDADVARGLRFRGAYTLSNFSYDEYHAATVSIDSAGDIVTVTDDFSGNEVPSVPKHNLTVSLAYERELSRRVTAFVKTSCSAVDAMYVDDANSERTEAYLVVDPTFGTEIGLGGVDLLLSGGANNLFDERYVGFVNINSTSRDFYEAGEPRSYFGAVNVGRRF